jgi:hypothetical protein
VITVKGFILRSAARSSRRGPSLRSLPYFSSYIRGEMVRTHSRADAWFTVDRETADTMVADLAQRADEQFDVVEYTHEPPAGCECSYVDDGNGETGPHVSITSDGCPIHGEELGHGE